MRYLTDIDMSQNELQNAIIHPSATEPVNPKVGQVYTDTSSIPAKLMWYDGEKWNNLGKSVPEKTPTAVEPTVSISIPGLNTGNLEVGTTIQLEYTATLNPGSYTYGPETGVTATSWRLIENDGDIISNTPSGVLKDVVVGDTTVYKIDVEVDHTAGAIPVTDQGTPYPAAQIKAGTKKTATDSIKGFRKYFYGTNKDILDMNSASIRALTHSSDSVVSGTTFDLEIPAGSNQVVIAFSSNSGLTLSSVIDTGAFGIDVYDIFDKVVVPVEGANGYDAIDYDVYVYTPEVSLNKNKYKVTIS